MREPLGSYMTSCSRLHLTCVAAVALPAVFSGQAIAQATWDRYQPGAIRHIIARERDEVMVSIRHGLVPLTRVSAEQFPTRALVQYQDSTRPTSPEHLTVLKAWVDGFRVPVDVATVFKSEALFTEGSLTLWIPIQAVLLKPLRKEVHRGDPVALYLAYVGAQASDSASIEWVFMVNE